MKRHVAVLLFAFGSINVLAQSVGIAGTVRGAVADRTGAAVVSASVTLENEFTHYKQVRLTDESGNFVFTDIPPAPYHLFVSAAGFQLSHWDVDVRSTVPIDTKIVLAVAAHQEIVHVRADTPMELPLLHTRALTKKYSTSYPRPRLPPASATL